MHPQKIHPEKTEKADKKKIREFWEIIKQYYQQVYDKEIDHIENLGYLNEKGREIAEQYQNIPNISDEVKKKIILNVKKAQDTVFKISNLLSYKVALMER